MNNIMVCVTKQKTCQRLIDYGKGLMTGADDSIHIIHVAENDYNFLGNTEEGSALEFLYEKAREIGAELTVLKSDNVIETLIDLARENDITKVIAGASGENGAGFLRRLDAALGAGIELIVVPVEYS